MLNSGAKTNGRMSETTKWSKVKLSDEEMREIDAINPGRIAKKKK